MSISWYYKNIKLDETAYNIIVLFIKIYFYKNFKQEYVKR